MTSRPAPPPLEHLVFVSKDADKNRWLTFHAIEKDIPHDPTSRTLVVLPEKRGCVMLVFDPRPGGDSTIIVQSVKHGQECAVEGLPRKYGTRAMILGTLNVLKYLAQGLRRYPHLKEIVLEDEATYPCPPLSNENGGTIRTFATDLLLSRQTYYERHLNVRPSRRLIADIVDSVKRRVEGPIDVTFTEFWSILTEARGVDNDIFRGPRLVEWLRKRESEVKELFGTCEEQEGTWGDFFKEIHKRWGCAFFSCCWWRLCVLFGMTRLAGACWTVPLTRLPQNDFEIRHTGGAAGGGPPTKMRERAAREIKDATRKRVMRAERHTAKRW